MHNRRHELKRSVARPAKIAQYVQILNYRFLPAPGVEEKLAVCSVALPRQRYRVTRGTRLETDGRNVPFRVSSVARRSSAAHGLGGTRPRRGETRAERPFRVVRRPGEEAANGCRGTAPFSRARRSKAISFGAVRAHCASRGARRPVYPANIGQSLRLIPVVVRFPQRAPAPSASSALIQRHAPADSIERPDVPRSRTELDNSPELFMAYPGMVAAD